MRCLPAMIVVLLIISAIPPAISSSSADAADGRMLIDLGNGTTYWCDIVSEGSYASVATVCAGLIGLSIVSTDAGITAIGGMEEHSVAGQPCSWTLYLWDAGSGRWMAGEDMGSEYRDGCFALGFYPDQGIVPTETPDEPTAWTSIGGGSSSSSVSDSYGTLNAVVPVEWYRTYTTGFVDSVILAAGDRLYHTTGGAYGDTGSDKDPHAYCVNRYTGELVWDFRYAYSQGYEVTTPLIVGGMMVITATNGCVYCLDRYDGTLLDTLELEMAYPLDGSGNVIWDGRTFLTGATTPVYDSGAIYFGTSDGRVMCCELTRDGELSILWTYDPPATGTKGNYTGTKGCFYYHPPVITGVNGVRMLFIGSYEGNVHALDASTGEELWVRKVIDIRDANRPHPGTPGSVGSISPTSDGKLIVCCSDGGLSSLSGYVICIDAATGNGTEGSEHDWKLDILCNHPVVVADGFYAYVSPLPSGASELMSTDGTASEARSAVYKFDLDGKVIWVGPDCPLVKAPLTLADGVLYAMDYSAGVLYPAGGALTAIDAADGTQIWRLKLSPFSSDSYSMVAPTVIDGKIYVGNDYGAIYCISEAAGQEFGVGDEIVLENGFHHWSWFALLAVVIVSLAMLKRYY